MEDLNQHLQQIVTSPSTVYGDWAPETLQSPRTPSPMEAQPEETPCTACGKPRSRRGSVAIDPTSIHAARPYFPCTNMKCRIGSRRIHEREFVLWDAHGAKPNCNCGLPSKQGVMQRGDFMPGYGYWECAYGRCKYFSRDRKGRSVENGEVNAGDVVPFIPWLLYVK